MSVNGISGSGLASMWGMSQSLQRGKMNMGQTTDLSNVKETSRRPPPPPPPKTSETESSGAAEENIQKTDLEDLQEQLVGNDPESAAVIAELLQSFDEIDQNGDGISRDEMHDYAKAQGFMEPPPPPFNSENGEIEGREFAGFMDGAEGSSGLQRPKGPPPGGGPKGPPPGGAPKGQGTEESLMAGETSETSGTTVEDLDANGDGKISVEEYLQYYVRTNSSSAKDQAESAVNSGSLSEESLSTTGLEAESTETAAVSLTQQLVKNYGKAFFDELLMLTRSKGVLV
jgi:Ca2+-binding EF-hand superfamily protein